MESAVNPSDNWFLLKITWDVHRIIVVLEQRPRHFAGFGFRYTGSFEIARFQRAGDFVLRFPFWAKHDSLAASGAAMRPRKQETTGSNDLFRARLGPPTKACASAGSMTRTGSTSRGEEFFQHAFPHERSGPSLWRKRLGDSLELLLAEKPAGWCIRAAHCGPVTWRGSPGKSRRSPRTSCAKLLHAAATGLNRLANKHGVRLRQSFVRVAKRAAMMAGALRPCQTVQPPPSRVILRPGSPRRLNNGLQVGMFGRELEETLRP